MATSSALPSSPSAAAQGNPQAPPNFYAQAATAQPAASAKPANSEDTTKFRTAVDKLVTIFDKMEKLKPNGVSVEKKIKAIAQSLKDLKSEVFEGEEGDGSSDTDIGDGKTAGAGAAGAGGADQTNATSPPPVAPGGVAGTGA